MLEIPRRKPSRSPLLWIHRPAFAPTIQTVDDDGTRGRTCRPHYATVEIHHADGTVGSAVANGTAESSSLRFQSGANRWRYADGNCHRIARGITARLRIFPFASDSAVRSTVPAITAIEDDVGSVQGNIMVAAPRTTPPKAARHHDIGLPLKFHYGDSAGFATVDASELILRSRRH